MSNNILGRHTIWSGLLEWIEKAKNASDSQKITRHVPCQVSSNIKDGEAELKGDGWPQKLIMQLIPKHLIGNMGDVYLKNSKSVLFLPQNCEALESLTKVMSSGFAGIVHFTSVPNPNSCDIKVLILLYCVEKRVYLGFIPNDQTGFVNRLRKDIQQQKSSQMQRQGQGSQPMSNIREMHMIWSGLLEWIERPKNASDFQKITRHVPCQVSSNIADGWPQKLIMQLMPKHLIGNIGGAYLKNSRSVLFQPQNCEALESLTKFMSSGFAGCVHFTSVPNPNSCDIKVLILLYTVEKRAYLGFIPNDQTAFVDSLRKVIQQQKSSQMQRQGQGGATQSVVSSSMAGNVGAAPQLPVSNPTSQATTQQQQSLMMSQTNTMAMGGGQITQNIVSSSSPSGMGGMIGQNVADGLQPRLPTIRWHLDANHPNDCDICCSSNPNIANN